MTSDTVHKPRYPGKTGVGDTEVAVGPAPQIDHSDTFALRVSKRRDLAADFAACAGWDGGKGLFYGSDDKVRSLSSVAYPAFLHLKSQGKIAWEEVRKNEAFRDRLRAPRKDTLANVAVTLAARPSNKKEVSACSDYAYVLKWAEANEIEPERFVEAVQGVKLQDCKSLVREITKQKAGKPTTAPKARLRLALTNASGGKLPALATELEEAQAEALSAYLAERTEPFADAFHMLGALLDVLQKVGREVQKAEDQVTGATLVK